MAKQRGGLGRGLGSLLGGESETRDTEKAPVSRVLVENEEQGAQRREPAKASSESIAAQQEEQTLYTSPEDNITIKDVVERIAPVEEKKVEIPQESAAPESENDLDEVDIDLVESNPDQPRKNFKKEELQELTESIEKNGLLQAILVRPVEGGKYQIIAGERRWQACKQAGLKTVPVRITEADDDKAVRLALIENLQRSDLNPIEEAYGYRRMMERNRMTQSEVAQAVSKGRSTIANALRLLELPESAQQLLYEEKITAGHARAILSIPSDEGKAKLTSKLQEENLSVRETEAIARLLAGKRNKGESAPRADVPKSYKTVARSLKENLGTNVRVRSAKGKNKIEIEFADEEDLLRLFKLISKED